VKKALLLSAITASVIYAGGDIAPVEPAAPATADFWGQVGFSYEMNDNGAAFDLGDEENNKFSTTIVLGVEKDIGNGFGVGVEVAGWSDFGLDIAKAPRVSGEITPNMVGTWRDQTDAEVSQAYLTYSFGNTAIKAGRQALPKAVSPWAWTDTSAGVKDITYDAVVVANTDIANTTLIGAWVANAVNGNSPTHLGDDDTGIFALGMINKSLENTTLSAIGYYFADATYDIPGVAKIGPAEDLWSIWAAVESDFDGVNAGLQLAYVDGDVSGNDATVGVAAKVGSSWGDLTAGLVVGYIDGDYSLRTAGSGVGSSAFWTDALGGSMTADATGYSQFDIKATASYKLSYGKLWGDIAYFDYDGDVTGDRDNTFGARIGYSFTVAGVDASVQYRAWSEDRINLDTLDKQRIRVEAFYKF
jgi:hypothetical protein